MANSVRSSDVPGAERLGEGFVQPVSDTVLPVMRP